MASKSENVGGSLTIGSRSLIEDLLYRESPFTHSSATRRVVIVMDALKEFSPEPLEWALAHVIRPGYVVFLLGVMPWLNLPLSCKTWLDVWTLDLQDLNALRERSEWRHDVKCQKVRAVIELCNSYGVELHMKVAMGHPLRLVVLEQTTSLTATWVVFDRHHRRNRAFYAERMPCNVVMMNNEGEADMLKVRPMMIGSEQGELGESPAVMQLVPKVMISEDLIKVLKENEEDMEKDGIKGTSSANGLVE